MRYLSPVTRQPPALKVSRRGCVARLRANHQVRPLGERAGHRGDRLSRSHRGDRARGQSVSARSDLGVVQVRKRRCKDWGVDHELIDAIQQRFGRRIGGVSQLQHSEYTWVWRAETDGAPVVVHSVGGRPKRPAELSSRSRRAVPSRLRSGRACARTRDPIDTGGAAREHPHHPRREARRPADRPGVPDTAAACLPRTQAMNPLAPQSGESGQRAQRRQRSRPALSLPAGRRAGVQRGRSVCVCAPLPNLGVRRSGTPVTGHVNNGSEGDRSSRSCRHASWVVKLREGAATARRLRSRRRAG